MVSPFVSHIHIDHARSAGVSPWQDHFARGTLGGIWQGAFCKFNGMGRRAKVEVGQQKEGEEGEEAEKEEEEEMEERLRRKKR